MKTLAELKQMNFIPHHECACCGVFVGYYVNEPNPWFDPSCDCCSGGGHYDTWEKVFKWYNQVFEKESEQAVNAAWESAKAPCEYCGKNYGYMDEDYIRQIRPDPRTGGRENMTVTVGKYNKFIQTTAKFCPMCGRDLEVK